MTSPASAPRPEPLRPGGLVVGVVGAGGMAHTHLAAWQRLRVSARVYSPSGRAQEFAADYGATNLPSLEALIGACDVVDICSPTGTHLSVARQAAAAGRHVICEKPLALTHADAAALVRAAGDAGVQLHVAHVVRYFEGYARVRDMVLAGDVGAAHTMELRRTGAAPASAWFHDEAASGGVLMDQMIHDFDYARWVFGEVATVSAQVDREPAGSGTGGVATHGSTAGVATQGTAGPAAGSTDRPVVRARATLTHVSGAISHLTGGWLASDAPWTTSLTVRGNAGDIRHTNSEAAIVATGNSSSATAMVRRIRLGDDLPYDRQLADFLTAIGGGSKPRLTNSDAVAALDLTLAARRSAESGAPVQVNPALT